MRCGYEAPERISPPDNGLDDEQREDLEQARERHIEERIDKALWDEDRIPIG